MYVNCTSEGDNHYRGGTETNRQCFADICKSRQSRFGSKSRIYCRIDALKTINTAQRQLDNKHRQLILPICTRFIANLALPILADIGKALPISFRATPNWIFAKLMHDRIQRILDPTPTTNRIPRTSQLRAICLIQIN